MWNAPSNGSWMITTRPQFFGAAQVPVIVNIQQHNECKNAL